MKKNQTKLQLKTNTIRMLQYGELEQVNGGRATFTCSAAQTGCSSNPPQHTPGSNGGGGGNPGGGGGGNPGGGGGGNPGNP